MVKKIDWNYESKTFNDNKINISKLKPRHGDEDDMTGKRWIHLTPFSLWMNQSIKEDIWEDIRGEKTTDYRLKTNKLL